MFGQKHVRTVGDRECLLVNGESVSPAHEALGYCVHTVTEGPLVSSPAGRVAVERIPYVVDQAVKALDGVRHLILVGAKAPVAFFAYPNKPASYPRRTARSMFWQRPKMISVTVLSVYPI